MSASPNSTAPSSSNTSLSSDATAVTITLALVGGIVLIVIAVLVYCYKKKNKNKKMKMYQTNLSMQDSSGAIHSSMKTINSGIEFIPLRSIGENSYSDVTPIEKFLEDILNEKPIRFTQNHLIDFSHNFAEKLGSGGFGVVYKGELPNGMLVAIKVLHKTSDKRAEEQFMAEMGTIGRTYHINLVRLYGFCYTATVKALVYEYMCNGSLDRYLFNRNIRLEWGKLHEIAVGTAKGIRYLHEECQKKIIHYDIKPGNVLLDEDFSPKVADFGLAKLCDRENTHVTLTGGRGTPGYAAPELWMPFAVTQKCDVYSFGMLLFELLGQRRNLDVMQDESKEWFPRWVWERFEAGELESVMLSCRIQEQDREKAERVSKVALSCVQFQPEARPTMGNVVRMLEGEQEICINVNPFQYLADGMSGAWSSSTGDSISRGTATEKEISSVRV